MITCASCGAVCNDAKDEGRFQRRHPSKCQKRQKFNNELVASIEQSIDREIALFEKQVEELTDQDIDSILLDLDLTVLTDWEKKFIQESVRPQWSRIRWLSDKQRSKLVEIRRRQP